MNAIQVKRKRIGQRRAASRIKRLRIKYGSILAASRALTVTPQALYKWAHGDFTSAKINRAAFGDKAAA